jgi:hypothetical protein
MPTESVTKITTAPPTRRTASNVDVYPADGVFAGRRKKKVILSEVVEFKTSELRRRRPCLINEDTFFAAIDDE